MFFFSLFSHSYFLVTFKQKNFAENEKIKKSLFAKFTSTDYLYSHLKVFCFRVSEGKAKKLHLHVIHLHGKRYAFITVEKVSYAKKKFYS